MSDASRRRFLQTLPALAAGVAGCSRARPYDPRAFPLPDRSDVALLPAANYAADLVDVVTRGLQLLRFDARGRRVLLKPNLVEYEQTTVINTNAALVGAAAEALLKAGAAAVIVAEGPGHRRDIEYLVTSTGLFDRLRDLRIPFVDLNHDDLQPVALRSRFTGLTRMSMPRTIAAADLIVSMPKLKTHHWTGMTCSMKNLFGTVPGAVYGWPKNVLHMRGITQSILDLSATLRPALAIVDAIDAMEGDGPIMGSPRRVGMVAMGRDPVAVDATCARVMSIDPRKVAYLREGAEFLGNLDQKRIRQLGERPERFAGRFFLLPEFEHLRG